ncbi:MULTISPECIES: DUF4250 domain-containing protein [Photobacterium]|uniref:DUF4250 domain-containing protein n=1 Tax=Photobacterium ganghwense TaxID=320778 RepID=A0A0J1HIV4_9GAMM|nr:MULTISPECIES: DUF4250 domain-containing protein [Photobacterium]KLV11558.1 hypothetical protein ABT57_02160 [Photobacterium ganghwense]MBV1841487.1 DUF4250 domain-containing protein [Photobacterium ganghwense]PSU08425.1 DUF4250 domain-containing protein [Photobacterium ganghwense]QSV15233.1 DUF4250 domain-containing protein [Photobacterium ganghwense]
MEINNLLRMDGHIVLGIVNEKLRLECSTLEELASRYELDSEELNAKMELMGFRYDPINNQFK